MAFLSFISPSKVKHLEENQVALIKAAVSQYLPLHGIQNFRLFVSQVDSIPVLLIKAKTSAGLEQSTYLGRKLISFVKKAVGHELGGVFWTLHDQFHIPSSKKAEQVDTMSQAVPSERAPTTTKPRQPQLQAQSKAPLVKPGAKLPDELLYDVKRLAKDAMEVKEISFNEFNEITESR